MDNDVKILDLKTDDCQEVSNLNNDCLDVFWSDKMFIDECLDESKHYFVAKTNNKIVGFFGFAHIIDEAHIMNIAVSKDYRKQGIATKLFNFALEQIRALKITSITLEVNEHNLKAIKFYEKLGFSLVGKRANYYNNKDGALIYWLYL